MGDAPRLYGLTTSERIKALSIEREGGCWIWQRSTTRNGYPRIRVGGRTRLAHRVAYETFIGPIPDGLHIDHTCFQSLCVNPAHLEAVTQAENNRRSWQAGRVTTDKAQAAHVSASKVRQFCRRGSHRWVAGQKQCGECARERRLARASG